MFNELERSILEELLSKELDRIKRDFADMDRIGDSFFINEGLLFENMHVRKKLETRLAAVEQIQSKLKNV
jgi:hypothetical protein